MSVKRTSEYLRNDRRRQVAAWHAEGLTNAQMADRLGVGKHAISSYLTKLGLPENVPPRPDRRAIKLANTPWDATPGMPRPETDPRDGTMIGQGSSITDRNIAAIRALHRAIMVGGAQ